MGAGRIADAQQHAGEAGERAPVRADGHLVEGVQAEAEADQGEPAPGRDQRRAAVAHPRGSEPRRRPEATRNSPRSLPRARIESDASHCPEQDASMSGTGDHVVVVGAASKGIIQREFQHHAMVYRRVESIVVRFMRSHFFLVPRSARR